MHRRCVGVSMCARLPHKSGGRVPSLTCIRCLLSRRLHCTDHTDKQMGVIYHNALMHQIWMAGTNLLCTVSALPDTGRCGS